MNKYRIVESFYKDNETAELKKQYRVEVLEKYRHPSFFLGSTEFEFWSFLKRFKTLKEATKFYNNSIVEIPEDKIIKNSK